MIPHLLGPQSLATCFLFILNLTVVDIPCRQIHTVTRVWLLLRIVLAQSTHSEERVHSKGVLSWLDHCVGIPKFINPAIWGCAYGLILHLDIMYLSISVEGLFTNLLSVQLGV